MAMCFRGSTLRYPSLCTAELKVEKLIYIFREMDDNRFEEEMKKIGKSYLLYDTSHREVEEEEKIKKDIKRELTTYRLCFNCKYFKTGDTKWVNCPLCRMHKNQKPYLGKKCKVCNDRPINAGYIHDDYPHMVVCDTCLPKTPICVEPRCDKINRGTKVIIGWLDVGVQFGRNLSQPHKSSLYEVCFNITHTGKFYTIKGEDIKSQSIMYMFWLENAGHASFGQDFIMQIADEHKTGSKYSRLKSSLYSCGECLCLEFIPYRETNIPKATRPSVGYDRDVGNEHIKCDV